MSDRPGAQYITCPKCKGLIPLTEALSQEIEARARSEILQIEADLKRQLEAERAKVEEAARIQADERAAIELQALKEELGQKKSRIDALEKERAMLREEGRREAEGQIRALGEELDRRGKKIAEAAAREVELFQRQQRLKDREAELELEKAKAVAEARGKAEENNRLALAEKDKVIADALRQVEELKRKVEQGSQQLQGEAQEIELERMLRAGFPLDEIVPVKSGVKGADVVQRVMAAPGKYAGSILWESKRTKTWSDDWIRKMKEDQRAENAQTAVIVSRALPASLRHVALVDGVWISDLQFAGLVATLLRHELIEVAQARSALAGREEKKDLVYQYLSGPEFKARIETLVEAFAGMKNDLDSERRAMEKIWAKRETEIRNAFASVARMYGNLQGMMSLPPIRRLELPAGDGEASAG